MARDCRDETRQHCGETLLALAAHTPRWLGALAAALREEKKQPKERLVYIMKYRKSGPMVAFLSLLLAAVAGACSLVSGTESVTPAEPAAPQGENQTPPEEAPGLEDGFTELRDGLRISFPSDIADQLMVITGETSGEGTGQLVSVYEKKSWEDTKADWDYDGGGFLFGIDRYTQAQYEQYLTQDGSGISPFATGGGYYYMHTFATDVQFYRSDVEEYTHEITEPWQQLSARVNGILSDFTVRNGLEPFSRNSSGFTYDGAHRYVLYANGTWEQNLILTLSQPGIQGKGGIWCVEQYQDAYGSNYLQFPGDGITPAAEYYREAQSQADAGERTELLDPMQTALAWMQDYYGGAPSVTVDNLTMAEGEPAGNIWARISDLLSQEGTLELGIYDEKGSPGSHVETFREPAYESYPGLTGDAASGLWSRTWVRAEPVIDYWWRGVRYATETGDEVFFLKNNGLVCIRQNGTEEWFRNAFWTSSTPYEVMYGICQYWARYAEDGSELFTEEEVNAAVETVRQMFGTEPWNRACTVQSCEWDAAESQWMTTTFLENGSGPVYGAVRENTIVVNTVYTSGNQQSVQGTTLEPENTYEWHFWLIRADKESPWEIVDMGV